MSELVRCAEGGFLVGPSQLVPDDPAIYQWPPSGAGTVVGCNHLVCQRCHQRVIQRPGFDATRELKRQRAGRLPAVYAACSAGEAGWEEQVQAGALERDPRIRLYLCRCAQHGEMRLCPVEAEPDGPPGGPQSWRCAGHPRATAAPPDHPAGSTSPDPPASPAAPDTTTAAAFVAAALDGAHGGPEAIDHRYHLAADPAQRQALGEALLAQLTSDEPRRRLRALGFFARNPLVPEAARFAERYAAHRELFAADALFALEVLAERIDPRHQLPDAAVARALLREALLAGAPLPALALARLASFDQAWLAEHAAAAIAAVPEAERTVRAGDVVYALRYLGLDASGRRTDDGFAELVRRAAAVPGVDRRELGQHLVEATGGTTAELVQRALKL